MKRLLSVLSVFAITSVAAGTASAGPIVATPTGLHPGDHFRIAFVTTGTTTATSPNISTYDTFVTAQAGGATYNGSTITWSAIASTTSVSAITHIGVTNDAVYLVDGTLVSNSDSTSGLWSGSLQHALSEDINKVTSVNESVWTGTTINGGALSGYELGHTPVIFVNDFSNYGISDPIYAGNRWVNANAAQGGPYLDYEESSYHMYGISQDLIVSSAVPEPSTAMLAGLGGIAIAIRAYRRLRATVATTV